MREKFQAGSSNWRRVGLLVIAGTFAIAGSIAMLQPRWLDNRDADANLNAGERASPSEVVPLLNDPENSNPEAWKIPEVNPRDRTDRPLLELVGVFAGKDHDRTALIREKEGPTFTYRVGDKISGNRELIEIHDTYVLLQNPEYVERLRLRHRALEPRYRPEDLESLAEHLENRSEGAHDQTGENR